MQITLTNVTLAYTAGQSALSDINCTIPDGALVAVLGPSGAGKTTLLNLLAGLLTPTRGHIEFHGTASHPRVGMAFQDFALYPHLTVAGNIGFPLKMAHVRKALRRPQVAKLAQMMHLTKQLHQYPHELSGGQQQRVAIARALVRQPDLLLLDEPLANLDAKLRAELRTTIHEHQRGSHTTTLLVTHDPEDARQLADLVLVLRDGRIQQFGPPAKVLEPAPMQGGASDD